MKSVLFIDGENFRQKIASVFKANGKPSPVWHQYDFKGLLSRVLPDVAVGEVTFYFAKLQEHPDTKQKSKELVEKRRLLKNHLDELGFNVELAGRVRGQYEESGTTKKEVLVFREKGVDVRIAVDMVSLVCDKQVDRVILGSSDSDLVPAVREISKRGATSVYLGFETQPNKGLAYVTHKTVLIRDEEVLSFAFQPPLLEADELAA